MIMNPRDNCSCQLRENLLSKSKSAHLENAPSIEGPLYIIEFSPLCCDHQHTLVLANLGDVFVQPGFAETRGTS